MLFPVLPFLYSLMKYYSHSLGEIPLERRMCNQYELERLWKWNEEWREQFSDYSEMILWYACIYCISIPLMLEFIRVGSCSQNQKMLWLFWSKNEPQQSFQNPQKNIHWEIIRVDFYHRDNGDVVCLSEITLSVKDTSSCFLCACIFHSWTLRESIQLHRLSFQLFQCTCDPLIRGFIIGLIQTTTNTCL